MGIKVRITLLQEMLNATPTKTENLLYETELRQSIVSKIYDVTVGLQMGIRGFAL